MRSILSNLIAIIIIIPIALLSYEFISGSKVDIKNLSHTVTNQSVNLELSFLQGSLNKVVEGLVSSGSDKVKEESTKLVDKQIDEFTTSLLSGLTSDSNPTEKTTLSETSIEDLEADLKIAVFADSHESFDNLEKAVKEVNTKQDISFVVHLGDLSRVGELSQLKESKSKLDNLSTNYFVIPGDHDLWATSGTTNFKRVFNKDYQKFETQDYVFLFVNNADTSLGLDYAHEEWLISELSKGDLRVWVIFMHNPLYSSYSPRVMGEKSSIVKAQADKILKRIRESEKVIAIVAGDQHKFNIDTDPVRGSLKHIVVGALTNERNLQEPRFAVLGISTDTKDVSVVDISL